MSPPSKRLARPAVLALLMLAPFAAWAATNATPPAAPAKAAPAKPGAPAPAAEDAKDPVVATVNGIKVHISDVAEEQRELGQRASQMSYADLLARQVNVTLFLEAGHADKLQNDPQLKKNLAKVEDRLVADVYVQRIAEKVVTEDALRQRYDQMVKDKSGEEEVHARHILVKTEDEAKAIVLALDKGGDFAKLADEKSAEKGNNGGDLGWFTRDKMVPAFSDAAFALKKGEYTKTPIQTQFGWHVIKVEDRRAAAPPTFQEVAEQLRNEIASEAVQAKLKELTASAKIEQFNSDGSPVPAGGTPSVPGQPAPAAAATATPAMTPADTPAPAPAPAPAGKP